MYNTTPNDYEYIDTSFKIVTYGSSGLSSVKVKYTYLSTTTAYILFHLETIELLLNTYMLYRYSVEHLIKIISVIRNLVFAILLPITRIQILDWSHHQK